MAPTRVLCVCTGNMCRSPYLERRLRQLLPPGWTIDSAGTEAVEANPMDPPAALALTQRGADPGGFSGRQLTAPMIRESPLVLTATREQQTWVARLVPAAVNKVFIFRQAALVLERLPAASYPDLAALVRAMAAGRALVRTDEATGVPDPVGREPQVYDRIVGDLDDIASRLASRLTAAVPAPGATRALPGEGPSPR